MFANAGFPEAEQTQAWSDPMLDAVVISGNEETVAGRLRQLLSWGATELLVSVITVGENRTASWERTVRTLAEVGKVL